MSAAVAVVDKLLEVDVIEQRDAVDHGLGRADRLIARVGVGAPVPGARLAYGGAQRVHAAQQGVHALLGASHVAHEGDVGLAELAQVGEYELKVVECLELVHLPQLDNERKD